MHLKKETKVVFQGTSTAPQTGVSFGSGDAFSWEMSCQPPASRLMPVKCQHMPTVPYQCQGNTYG